MRCADYHRRRVGPCLAGFRLLWLIGGILTPSLSHYPIGSWTAAAAERISLGSGK